MNRHIRPLDPLVPCLGCVLLIAFSMGCNESNRPEGSLVNFDFGLDARLEPMDQAQGDSLTVDAANLPDASGTVDAVAQPCVPIVPAAAQRRPGQQDDGSTLTVTGREIAQYGRSQDLEGFPSNLLMHPFLPVLYVVSTSHDDRNIHVIDKETLAVLQTTEMTDLYAGLALDSGGEHLFVSGGDAANIFKFKVESDGSLTRQDSISVDGYVAFITYDAAQHVIWYTRWDQPLLHAVNLETREVVQTIELEWFGWQMYQIERTLYISSMLGETMVTVDLDSSIQNGVINLPGGLSSMCQIGNHLFLALSDIDQIGKLNIHSTEGIESVPVAAEMLDKNGNPLANSNVNAVVCDEAQNRVYAARGADNMIAVFDAENLGSLGLIPTGAYPNELALDETSQRIWIVEGQGGTGPSGGRTAKSVIFGAIRRIDLPDLNLIEATEVAQSNFLRPDHVFPFECDGFFPIPTKPEQTSPIEHIILIVKENKTFDCVFGDLDPNRADVDPALTLFGREITPNLHALADQFALSDNFYTEVEDSDIGHILLTATHLTEYVQRFWIEKDHARQLPEGYQVTAPAVPKVGNFFTHLMEHEVSLKILGEVVGINVFADGNLGQVGQHIDLSFPGGSFVNYTVKDETKARRLVELIEDEELKAFTYILLPNDHTLGTRIGAPTPESMVADNDYAVGLIVDALSHSAYWTKSAVIVLQDDPQGCRDHVDVHRSPLLVISPWARRGYISHTRASFLAVFNTMERILGVPPIARGDASAAPLWDMFTATADSTPFSAIPRQVPETVNGADSLGSALSAKLDFRGPDRNPSLGPLLEIYMAHRKGAINRQEAEAKLQNMEMALDRWLITMEESIEEKFSFDEGIKAYHQYLDTNRLDAPRFPSDGFQLGPNSAR